MPQSYAERVEELEGIIETKIRWGLIGGSAALDHAIALSKVLSLMEAKEENN